MSDEVYRIPKFVQITATEDHDGSGVRLHALDEDGDVWVLGPYSNKWNAVTDTREWKRL